ncbi:MAG: flavodoxin-dependent (E)-4-hydroxy-3-methylbut-2-enyl-diphosphate synthase, partial [Candidatus Aminicenantes bacterium]|nr:flavodoxin-dependent (E)-4-hydroxy-3-methylbut-2-enyl-diphosphate synthase [Candidatus Aminicenantes bacterium]
MFSRRKTRPIKVGGVVVGGGAPVVVQAMTKTDTRDVRATAAQVRRLERAGAEIVRLAVPDRAAAAALREIRKRARVPLVADIHFDHRLALAALEAGVDGLRLNPGNIGSAAKVREVVRAAGERQVPIRIGVNSGSLEKDILARAGGATAPAMVESAVRHVRLLEDLDFRLIKISLKASDVPRTLQAYRLLAEQVDYPLHAGITEAGRLLAGSVKSSAGLALLLAEGLADTVRVSLTAPPEKEVFVAWQILQALGLRTRGATFVSCPTCGRCEVDLMGVAARVEKTVLGLRVPLTVAVMGCTVNGPGEAKEADIGLACGRGGGVIFRKGKVLRKVPAARLA